MIRIGVLSPCFCTGGVERWLITLAKTLPRSFQWSGMGLTPGAPTDVDSCDELSRWVPIYGTTRFSNVNRDSPMFIYRKESWDEVVNIVCDCDILLVWGDTPVPEWYTGLVVAVAHGCVDWSKRQMEKYAGPRTRYVAVSREAAKAIPIPHRLSARIIHNGVEADRLQPRKSRRELRIEYGIRDDRLVVGYVGRFSDEKEPLAAAMAVSHINRMHGRAMAIYCGIGFDNGETERKVNDLCGKHVLWMKPTEVPETLEMADCIICASPLEGFGLTRVEAMFRGVPVICTNTGIIPEMTERWGKVCYTISSPLKVDELTWAVLTAVDDTKTVARAAIAAYEGFRSRKSGLEWARYFEGLMDEERRSATIDDRPALSCRGTE